MKQLITILVCLGLVFFSFSSAHAQAITYTKEVTYQAGELDNEFSSRVIAKAQVKQMILDDLADAAEKMSKAYDFPFYRGYGIPLFSCLIKIETVKETWKNRNLYYKAKTKTNLGNVLGDLRKFTDKKNTTAQISDNRETAKKALSEIEQINADVASSGDISGKQDAYNIAVNRLHATDWYEIARFSGFAGESQQAIDAYSKVIEYDPKRAVAYVNRGTLYLSFQKDKQLAVADFYKANQLYFNKAVDNGKAKNYQGCVANLDDALMLNPEDADAYFQRAYCNYGLGRQDKAKEDFKEAARLGHKKAQELLTAKGIKW